MKLQVGSAIQFFNYLPRTKLLSFLTIRRGCELLNHGSTALLLLKGGFRAKELISEEHARDLLNHLQIHTEVTELCSS